MAGAFQTAPDDTLELNVVRGSGDRTTQGVAGSNPAVPTGQTGFWI
jgi:hypothetical protein